MKVADVEEMFENPSPTNWPKSVDTVPADGLYLTDIFYDPKELTLPNDIMDSVKSSCF